MRDSKALDAEFVVYHESGTEVSVEKVSIDSPEHVERQRAAVFLDFVHLFLKLSEHRLAKQDLADVLDLPVDQVGSH